MSSSDLHSPHATAASAPCTVAAVRDFARIEVPAYLATHSESEYPEDLVDQMRCLGIFGATTPAVNGGSGMSPNEVLEVMYELARAWQPLAGMVGTHLKLCRDVERHGTPAQKETWLPAMASGAMICARGYTEQGRTAPESLAATVEFRADGIGLLNGTKRWVTHARHADRILFVARRGPRAQCVIVDPSRAGVKIGDELPRPGMLGVSLAEVHVNDYEFDPETDVLGGPDGDVTASLRGHDVTRYLTRAIGSADAVLAWMSAFVASTIEQRPPEVRSVMAARVGQIAIKVAAIRLGLHDHQRHHRPKPPTRTPAVATGQVPRHFRTHGSLRGQRRRSR
ncbi:acyl-CoA/acyl-ACP dehydrogenase [Streptomyces sp. TRM66268-LWL]|uniref:Acyl-CoA/acyl-ACP dehydrogenase n=1 Tax=Streptomyces polyasparticus TaxID=2767826 RepID=A0ABR7SVA1_9ACTN|nr:acyl-CoA dehydrogenase family protein [Streptomyces polyasparticus]MBC9719434.1 acyl-CoA/acyl-ACP dehydrogenase [Streptomyces polyasparticus]